jgi:hypothetical protein
MNDLFPFRSDAHKVYVQKNTVSPYGLDYDERTVQHLQTQASKTKMCFSSFYVCYVLFAVCF